MIQILIDTNFFMISHKNKIDILQEINRIISEEYKLITFTGVLDELNKITERSKGDDGVAARVALELIKRGNIEVLKSIGDVDNFIVSYIEKNTGERIFVCTADAELKKRLRDKNIDFICMRSKKRLAIC